VQRASVGILRIASDYRAQYYCFRGISVPSQVTIVRYMQKNVYGIQTGSHELNSSKGMTVVS